MALSTITFLLYDNPFIKNLLFHNFFVDSKVNYAPTKIVTLLK